MSSAAAAARARGLGPKLLEVRDLRVTFTRGGRRVHAVNGLSYELSAGEMLAIIGESGSGKTVGSRTLMGLLPPSAHVSGSALFDGTELVGMPEPTIRHWRGSEIAMVFQDPTRSLNPTMKIGTQITEAIRQHSDVDRAAAKERAIELLKLVHLPAAERRFHEYPHQMSGGMRQRVVIAIALAGEPRLLIADEATSALDVTTQAQIMSLLLELQDRLGMAIILISHDLGLAASYAQNVVVMYAGRAVEYAPARQLFQDVRMPYTRALMGAIPQLERPSHRQLPVISGQPPDPAALPDGCPFRPRCDMATDECAEAPPFLEHRPGHWWACWHGEAPAPATPAASAAVAGEEGRS
ncbi:MAG TPA: ABC transporter ATP-binding protein [Streptosporangiaceae bacterium]|nr:ABC transporter ATP-binding protein [Streptosporangiaceae bacterium]